MPVAFTPQGLVPMSCREADSMLHGVDTLLEAWLGIEGNDAYGNGKTKPRYCSQKAMNDLPSLLPKDDRDLPLKEMNRQLAANWDRGGSRNSGKQNWRWLPQLVMDPGNSGEKELEKVAAFLLGEKTWTNQVPICSGLTSGNDGKKRAIDLVRCHGKDSFDFIELKFANPPESVNGGHPLHAAVELLEYGVLYGFCRQYPHLFAKKGRRRDLPDLGSAKAIRLVVLGPDHWYGNHAEVLHELSKRINTSLEKQWHEECPGKTELRMTFGFYELSQAFMNDYAILRDKMKAFREQFVGYSPLAGP